MVLQIVVQKIFLPDVASTRYRRDILTNLREMKDRNGTRRIGYWLLAGVSERKPR